MNPIKGIRALGAWAVDEALANKPIGTAGHGKAA